MGLYTQQPVPSASIVPQGTPHPEGRSGRAWETLAGGDHRKTGVGEGKPDSMPLHTRQGYSVMLFFFAWGWDFSPPRIACKLLILQKLLVDYS